MSYFEAVPTQSGLNQLPSNPCKLLDFHLLSLADGQSYSGKSADREVLAVILGGQGTFIVNGQPFGKVGGRAGVFSGKPHSVYIPCRASYTITAHGPLEVGLCSAPSDLEVEPYVILPAQVTSGVWGAANFSRHFHQILTEAGQPDLPAARLIVGETYTPSGNWSTYPPHKHEVDNLPREAYHEEMYFFKVNAPDGFGMARFYTNEIDTGYVVRNNTVLMIPHGYHTVVSAPGYTTYYLWFLAGHHRVQAVADDTNVGWVGRTVPMLRDLGH
ncbi:MAG: 5-deoxy-glucuronate isomerase [Chloroflexi bacterium]|nr:5-deoxy-glucuronate isomerase [Chloroflexota bacterium]MCI0577765.1 5-deoxy-glucuronate isomerase [Chloroflexota bacterium]MCI0643429.1 5-deoxy-glucuronate isomerase [Chloroflexota bacterium]MCI0725912.1 5-deoxy-glucuronate isomerase [Chloroflexota bacterium]